VVVYTKLLGPDSLIPTGQPTCLIEGAICISSPFSVLGFLRFWVSIHKWCDLCSTGIYLNAHLRSCICELTNQPHILPHNKVYVMGDLLQKQTKHVRSITKRPVQIAHAPLTSETEHLQEAGTNHIFMTFWTCALWTSSFMQLQMNSCSSSDFAFRKYMIAWR